MATSNTKEVQIIVKTVINLLVQDTFTFSYLSEEIL
jgi:hypothetical protein